MALKRRMSRGLLQREVLDFFADWDEVESDAADAKVVVHVEDVVQGQRTAAEGVDVVETGQTVSANGTVTWTWCRPGQPWRTTGMVRNVSATKVGKNCPKPSREGKEGSKRGSHSQEARAKSERKHPSHGL